MNEAETMEDEGKCRFSCSSFIIHTSSFLPLFTLHYSLFTVHDSLICVLRLPRRTKSYRLLSDDQTPITELTIKGESMKRLFSTFFLTMLFAATAAAQDNAKLVGAWDMTLNTPQGVRNFPLAIKEEGGKLVPTPPFTMAEVKGNDVRMSMTVKFQDMDLVITYTGKIEGDAMKGDAYIGRAHACTPTTARTLVSPIL